MSVLVSIRRNDPQDEAPALEQRILTVWFRSPEGRSWNAIGGGATVAAAISTARESCPDDTAWHPTGWNDLYGD